MRVHRLEQETVVARPLPEVFAFFARAHNLERITPPWLRFEVRTPEPVRMAPGTLIEYRLRLHGIPLRWLTRIEEWDEDRSFVDRQLRGPYRLWHHTHRFEPVEGGTRMRDVVRYALPFGPLGRFMHGWLVRGDLQAIFDYRATRIATLLGP